MEYITLAWDALENANLWFRGLVDSAWAYSDQVNAINRAFFGV